MLAIGTKAPVLGDTRTLQLDLLRCVLSVRKVWMDSVHFLLYAKVSSCRSGRTSSFLGNRFVAISVFQMLRSFCCFLDQSVCFELKPFKLAFNTSLIVC